MFLTSKNEKKKRVAPEGARPSPMLCYCLRRLLIYCGRWGQCRVGSHSLLRTFFETGLTQASFSTVNKYPRFQERGGGEPTTSPP